jgi:hypothetical protein
MANNSLNLVFPKHLQTLSTIADLRAFKLSGIGANDTVLVTGRDSFNDGYGGFFVWDPFNTTEDDGITIIRPTFLSGAGRWLKIDRIGNPVS